MAHQSLMGHINTKQEVIEAFHCFDKDNKGTVEKSVLRQVLTELGDIMEDFEIDELIQQADLHRNGQIPYEEFVNLLFLYDGH
mmetsp:Transcript_10715/g.30084  ORF Transcript_10715/g.30084 Transcript_10715/m.30084 type:complete len:83 (-) Transcript_10715:34-282(-)|eukprot:CAMPEP_0119129786 /NCGR_PEP_ID=MMETSP1310-20130426/7384_1 /TAXON_ID=464262 /ORGANISM="Genus nov. species nov., Strain RCC2339" /LENGTH=82 /DNA_ID=CAMNT_0007120231 /DNA_START=129 /DNA_END=377 /DNA_ORIENTATION=+